MTLSSPRRAQLIGLLAFVLIFLWPTPAQIPTNAFNLLALVALMAIFWATEALPIAVTALFPLIFLPLMGIASLNAAASPYAQPVIFLLLGGFIAAMAMERSYLHKRIALFIVSHTSRSPAHLMAGFMIASAFLSLWISNTATCLMISPIAMEVCRSCLGEKAEGHAFTTSLLISCAWAASIGGLGTYIGTPPNLFVKAFIEKDLGRELYFTEWMAFGIPVVCVLLPLAWWWLRRFNPFDAHLIKDAAPIIAHERAQLGPLRLIEKRVAIILCLMAFFWIIRPFLSDLALWLTLDAFLPLLNRFSDTHIALMGAIAMFLVSSGESPALSGASTLNQASPPILNWADASQLPWGVILLFGGGLSLASAIQASGLALWLGESLSFLGDMPVFALLLSVVILVIFLTELTSNTATTAALVPVMAALAIGAHINPVYLAVPLAMAASCAFMLPVATGPNAVVFATGHIPIKAMMRAGFWLNISGSLAIAILCHLLIPLIFP